MSPTNYRGWLWSLAAVAGTATAAVVVYKYATRGVRDHGESDMPVAAETEESEDVDSEWLSEDEVEAAGDEQQQVVAVARGRNMLLAMFGLLLMVLVTVVSLFITWNSEDEETSFVEQPMFQPLMWIAVGIFTAASMELLTRSSRMNSEVPVLEDKAVFPNNASDFELIRQHNGKETPMTPKTSGQSATTENDDEEKGDVPGDVESVIKRADELFDQGQHARTREYLKGELPKYPPSGEMLWRLARACNYLVEEKSSPDEKKALAFEGLADAEKAYALDSDSAASNKWMAIMTSTVGNFRDLKEKIAGAYVIRDHIQQAIELDPTDATSHNILGQWCLAFADMTWIEKRAAAALFGTPPSATYEEAAQHFQAAENISPGFWKKNVFLLAQTFMKMKRTKEAVNWVLKAKAVPVKTKEDEEVAQEIASLMKQLKLQNEVFSEVGNIGKPQSKAEHKQKNTGTMAVDLGSNSAATTKLRAVAKKPTAGSAVAEPLVKPSPPSPSIVSIVAGDASLLMAASGICTVVLSGIVSMATVALDANLTSVTELRLFSPSMVTGFVLFTVGALNGMLRYSNRKANAAPGEIVLPPGHPPISAEKLAEMVDLDENGNPKKRISLCPLGF
ncbi:hypothetical protein PRNP1_013332 [Phytophthora ramorum]